MRIGDGRRGSRVIAAALAIAVGIAGPAIPVARAQVVLDPNFSNETITAGEYAPGLATDYLIRESYGRRAGDNLFHRFSRFDIPTGQSATFVEDAAGSGIRRIVARVGGLSASRIDGVLRSTIPNADLLLFNARGVVFGPNAQLDLLGSFQTASGDFIRFADDARFGDLASGPAVTLSAAAPSAWGFLSAAPAEIAVEGSTLRTPDGRDLSLVGGDLRIEGPGSSSTPTLAAPSGALRLVSLGAAGEVPVDARQPSSLDGLESLGAIRLTADAVVDASGTGDQILIVRADSLSLDDATIIADHLAAIDSGAGGGDDHSGIAVDIDLRGALRIGSRGDGTSGSVTSLAFRDESAPGVPGPDVGDGGDVIITADSFVLDGPGSQLIVGNGCVGTNLVCAPGTAPGGAGGRLEIDVDRFAIRNGAIAVVQTLGPGASSDATVRARRIEIGNDADAPRPGGEPFDTFLLSYNGGSFADGSTPPPEQAARGGDLALFATERLELENRGSISSRTFGNGRGGAIRIEAGDLVMLDSLPEPAGTRSGIRSDTNRADLLRPELDEGRAGGIDVLLSGDLRVEHGSIRSSAARGANGRPGEISLQALDGTIDLGTRAVVSSEIETGVGATTTLVADRIVLRDGAAVQSITRNDGAAGDIVVAAREIDLAGVSAAASRTGFFSESIDNADPRPNGPSGSVIIEGGHLRVTDGATISVTGSRDGAAGRVRIGAETPMASLTLDRGGTIEANTFGADAAGGDIEIDARQIRLDRAGAITASNSVVGGTGSIRLDGRDLRLLRGAEIRATSGVSGVGGDITIDMTGSVVADAARLTTDSQGSTPTNQGGNIAIDSELLLLSSTALRASAPSASGGEIRIVAGRFLPTAGNPRPDASGGAPELDGVVSVLAAETNTQSAVPRPSVAYVDPSQRLATGCESRTRAQGSLYVLPRPSAAPPTPLARADLASHDRFETAIANATPRARAFAQAQRAEVLLEAHQAEEALALARRAFATAASADDPLARFELGATLARALEGVGDRAAALDLLRHSLRLGEALRRDQLVARDRTAAGTAESTDTRIDARTRYDEVAARLIGLLLDTVERDASAPNGADTQAILLEVRDQVETWRSAELENHFGDACLASGRRRGLDPVPGALVLYPILLPDRVGLLTSFEGRFAYRRATISREALDRSASDLRRLLEKRTTRQYLRPAQALYDAMIRPLEAQLDSEVVEALVVVPDGVLRTIPFAALHDRERDRFLVDMKAVALVPSLRLVEPTPIAAHPIRVLAGGIERATNGFERLAFTREEIAMLRGRFPSTRVLFGEDFRVEAFANEIESRPYSIVHVATHGRVEAEGDESFLVTHDGRLDLDRLSEMISATRYRREHPLDLLTLSACETAAGSEDAALGLAGVAVRAGARSALATLWPVNDQATARLVDVFYAELDRPGQTRAGALRVAQRHLREQGRFDHPGYWSPFLMISSWL